MELTREQQETIRRIIGKAIEFPIRFSEGEGKFPRVDGIALIEQSIHQILSTRLGERLFMPEFGSNLPDLVFEPEDDKLYSLLTLYTYDALKRWEPRIEVRDITILSSRVMLERLAENAVGILINYSIRQSNTEQNYVFPFKSQALPIADSVTGDPLLKNAIIPEHILKG